jgi:hypothetical protein
VRRYLIPMFRSLATGLALAVAAARPPASVVAQVPAALSDSAWAALSTELSEPSGFFDTDNLVSNEDSYLHAITTLKKLGVTGGAYLGVGPDQNFSYIAAIRPRIAFIIDIRRDNLLELLLFKAIFSLARNRLEYLCQLFGRKAPNDTMGWAGRDVTDLLQYLDRAPPDSAADMRVRDRVARLGMALSAVDLATIGRFHREFIVTGPALRMTTFNRGDRPDYPDYRRLVLATDLSGRRASFLASESAFQYLKEIQGRNLIVPVVGNFAGEKALVAVGRYLSGRGEPVSAFYTSNVEQYLLRDDAFDRFARNVAQLPRTPRSVFIRSYFPYGRSHPQWVAGYLAVQLVQTIDSFVAAQAAGGLRGYLDLVTRDLIDPR